MAGVAVGFRACAPCNIKRVDRDTRKIKVPFREASVPATQAGRQKEMRTSPQCSLCREPRARNKHGASDSPAHNLRQPVQRAQVDHNRALHCA